VIDGGNSYWGDSIRRATAWTAKGLHFVDLGTSGGLSGARNGACFMLGGPPETKAVLTPILLDLCVKGGFVDAGGPGSGHFVKLVHNGIEFGMLQSIGEGMHLLEKYKDDLPVADVLSCWRNGSVIRSWLIDLMHEGYTRSTEGFATAPAFNDVPAYIEDTGEVNWLVSDAMQMEVPIPVIALSVMELLASRDKEEPWAKAVALMRHGFGGHPFGAAPALQHERKTSRVGDIYRGDA
ncbi:MAG: NAD(P)-binding domain-containing protein, partial [bacterium]